MLLINGNVTHVSDHNVCVCRICIYTPPEKDVAAASVHGCDCYSVSGFPTRKCRADGVSRSLTSSEGV